MQTADLLRQAWSRNKTANLTLLGSLDPTTLSARLTEQGFSVAQHLQHLGHDVQHWLLQLNADHARELGALELPDSSEASGRKFLQQVERVWLGAEDQLLSEVLSRREKPDTLPHEELELLPVHMLVHDAYHRGQIMAALRTGGFPLPDPERLWGTWRS